MSATDDLVGFTRYDSLYARWNAEAERVELVHKFVSRHKGREEEVTLTMPPEGVVQMLLVIPDGVLAGLLE